VQPAPGAHQPARDIDGALMHTAAALHWYRLAIAEELTVFGAEIAGV